LRTASTTTGLAVVRGLRAHLGLGVLRASDVAHAHRQAAPRGHHQLVELGDGLHAALHAKREGAVALVDGAAGDLHVLRHERALHVHDGEPEGLQARGVEHDVHLTAPTAEDGDAADARERLDLPTDPPVGVLGHFTGRPGGAHRREQHRGRVGVGALDARLLNALREEGQRTVDAVAHLLGRLGGVLVEVEAHDHHAEALVRDRAQLVDARDGVDGLLELVAHLGLNLFG
jgi:hypothetical protein